MKKKKLAGFLAMVSLAVLLAACAGKKSAVVVDDLPPKTPTGISII